MATVTVLAVRPHPDDESSATGGLLARLSFIRAIQQEGKIMFQVWRTVPIETDAHFAWAPDPRFGNQVFRLALAPGAKLSSVWAGCGTGGLIMGNNPPAVCSAEQVINFQ